MSSIEVPYEKIQDLKDEAGKISELLKGLEENLVIICKVNPDNLCASGILVSCLREIDLGCHIIFIDNNSDLDERIKKINYLTYIFIGFQIKELPSKLLKDEAKNIIIIGNKITIDKRLKLSWDTILTLSLEELEIPVMALSNAGLAYFIAKEFTEDYSKFSGLAVVGGLANKQVDSKSQELIGINRFILDEGNEEGILEESKGTRISGRESLPIHLALKYSINPYFPGLTGNEEACTSFVSKLKIPMKKDGNWRTFSSLTTNETKKLYDRLIALLVEGNSQFRTELLFGTNYIILTETSKSQTRDAEEYLWLLEGACQIKKYGLALAVILGDRTNLYDELKRKMENYHGKAAQIIEKITQDSKIVENKEYYRIIRNQDVLDLESAPLVMKALVESNIISIEIPLLLHIKEANMNYLYMHDSPTQIQKGFRIYHFFEDLVKEKTIVESCFKGENEFFRLALSDEEYLVVLEEFEKALKKHHEGTKAEANSKEKDDDK
ncbi:MAG: hypothetical protein KAU62_15110 [Candidatus Heimdallarchaeota archaeon]|nr:hypothetical protein [Candidatus Heimdallarchaeota archaeon]MCG3257430.1 hypothetical protein [Candidatus Heimdallarchaeota archaeon]MCK4612483.1 hypothetical protein [Candidatus Heimdallarchaeota archaeon]